MLMYTTYMLRSTPELSFSWFGPVYSSVYEQQSDFSQRSQKQVRGMSRWRRLAGSFFTDI